MLNDSDLVAFVAVSSIGDAAAFYSNALGLTITEQTDHVCVLNANGTALRLTVVAQVPRLDHTVIGWNVLDIEATALDLRERSVQLNRYEGLDQDELGIWTSPNGDRVGWFDDPDGNTLSITQFA